MDAAQQMELTVLELALGVAGMLLAYFARQWAMSIKERLDGVRTSLEKIAADIHYHRVRATEALGRLDERVKRLEDLQRKP